jgi:hypothetical protein
MLALILGFITGLAGPLAQVANNITDLNKMKVQAQNNTELAQINSQLEAVHDRRATLIAEAGSRVSSVINASARLLLALGPIVILNKILVWDKAWGSLKGCVGDTSHMPLCKIYNTDALDPNLWWVVMATVGFYFLTANRNSK